MKSTNKTPEKFKILVFGMDNQNLRTREDTVRDKYTISYTDMNTSEKFDDFDGVIIFQGSFESVKIRSGVYTSSWTEISYDENNLHIREKEIARLHKKNGFSCHLLTKEFTHIIDAKYRLETDLTKTRLKDVNLVISNLQNRITSIQFSKGMDAFKKFIENYGAASTTFRKNNTKQDFKAIAHIEEKVVGFSLNQQEYFIPSLPPSEFSSEIEDFFCSLCDALISCHTQKHTTVPTWAKEFDLSVEKEKEQKIRELEEELSKECLYLKKINSYKNCLCLSGPELAEVVGKIFSDGMNISVDDSDEHREDLKLLDESGKTIALCEIKGVNRGIKREQINQADSHRERAELPIDFPTLLIVNTAKEAQSLEDKNQLIANEQIKHAFNTNILILRTFDLLGMLRLHLLNKYSKEEILDLLLKNKGWLQYSNDTMIVIHE